LYIPLSRQKAALMPELHSLFKSVLENEVYPALGCTDPITCAYAATIAAAELTPFDKPVDRFELKVDPGTLKNGNSVAVPNSGGAKGNVQATALGAVLAAPDAKLEIMSRVDETARKLAAAIVESESYEYECLTDATALRVDATVHAGEHSARCVLIEGHTNIGLIQVDGEDRFRSPSFSEKIASKENDASTPLLGTLAYRDTLSQCDISTLLDMAESIDEEDRQYLQRGVEMNLAMAARGYEIPGIALQIQHLLRQGYCADDLFYRAKLQVAAGIDARMAGVEQSVMTSGGSGNQGLVAIVTTYLVGRKLQLDEDRILRGIAAAHLLNAYVKCFVGENASICGCALSAAIGAAGAIVFMKNGADEARINLAINNVIGDLSGLICDGAKPGCAMKGVSAVDTAIRSGLMALDDFGLTPDQGLAGATPSETIKNLARITHDGMYPVDPTVLAILREKG
jgi:L-cysteine desulfidase